MFRCRHHECLASLFLTIYLQFNFKLESSYNIRPQVSLLRLRIEDPRQCNPCLLNTHCTEGVTQNIAPSVSTMGLTYAFLVIFLNMLVPTAVARRGGSGPSIDFDAPPLVIANLVAYILLLATLIQLATAFPALFRAGVRLPATGIVVSLVLLALGYALSIPSIILDHTAGIGKFQILSGIPYNNLRLQLANASFLTLADPAIFATVILVLHNRYHIVRASVSRGVIASSSAAAVLFLIMAVLILTQVGIVASLRIGRVAMSQNVYHAFVAFHVLATMFLVASAFLVKSRTKKDTVTSFIIFAIVPLLSIHALVRLVFAIVEARVSLSDLFNSNLGYALGFATTVIYGLSYVAAMSLLVYLLGQPRLWSADPHSAQGAPSSQYLVQGPAQFPGQFGYPQQPLAYPEQRPQCPLQHAYVAVPPTQNQGIPEMQMQPVTRGEGNLVALQH